MRAARLALYFLVGLLLGGVSALSHAAVHFKATGWFLATPSGGGPASVVSFAPTSGGVVGSSISPQSITSGRVPVTVPVTVAQKIGSNALAKLAVGAARRTIPGIVVGAAIAQAMTQAGIECDLQGCRGVPAVDPEAPAQMERQPAIKSWLSDYPEPDFASACHYTWAAGGHPEYVFYGMTDWNASNNSANCARRVTGLPYCPEGVTCGLRTQVLYRNLMCPDSSWSVDGSYCVRACPAGQMSDPSGACVVPGMQPMSDDQAAAQLDPQMSSPAGVDVAQQAAAKQIPMPADPPQVSGPASVTSPPQVTTKTANGQTLTSTTTTTVNNNYAGDTYTYNVVNNTITTNSEGQTVSTDSEDVPEDVQVADSDLPGMPELYERKYPDGLVGVWNTRIAEIKAKPLFGLVAVFAPTNISGGSCPSWSMDLNIGPHMMYGSGSISPPCWLWGAIKAIMIIGALLLARSLIFGG